MRNTWGLLGRRIVSAPAWTPASISASRAVFWLRADLGVNTGAKTWTDQLNGNVFSASAMSQDSSGINGQQRVVFPGSASNNLTCAGLTASSTKAQGFMIGKLVTGGLAFWNLGGNGGNQYFPYNSSLVFEDFGSTAQQSVSSFSNVVPGAISWEVSADASGNWTPRFQGVNGTTVTGNTIGWKAAPAGIGFGAGGTWNGEIEEVLILKDNLTTGEHASWVAYVLARYGIAA